MTALWLPDAIRKPIPLGANDPTIIPVGAIFHVAVSMSDSLRAYFDGPSGGIESHGYIRLDGTIEQYRDFSHEADAQGAGNSWTRGGKRYGFHSWETEGMGNGVWTKAQLDAIRRIITFEHGEFAIPLRRCPGSFESGFGYHCLFGQWNANAHSCPGPRRVKQFNDVIVPWMREQSKPQPSQKHPNADAIAKHAARGVAATKGKRRAVFARIRDLAKSIATKKEKS